jgi:hypothetical protein
VVHLYRIASARRTSFRSLVVWAFLSIIALSRPAAADFTIEGSTNRPAWSGYWWPMLVTRGYHLYDQQGSFVPLLKYGSVTGDFRPLTWERRFKLTTNPNNDWWGHCNGWAAAAITEPEPTQSVSSGGNVFNIGEIKGLLSVCHQGDPVDFFSGRGHKDGANSSTDLRALMLHRALLYYVRDRQEAIILNISDKPEVWNYPVYAFRMYAQTGAGSGLTQITATLLLADDDVQPHFVGTRSFTRIYSYWVQGDATSVNGVTAAEWTGSSVWDHPQFAWHPGFQRAYEPGLGEPPNPIDYNWVRRLGQIAANGR